MGTEPEGVSFFSKRSSYSPDASHCQEYKEHDGQACHDDRRSRSIEFVGYGNTGNGYKYTDDPADHENCEGLQGIKSADERGDD